MNKVKSYHISLHEGELIRVPTEGLNLFFTASRGQAWLTAAGDQKDYLVSAGGTLEIPAGRHELVLQSLCGDLELDVSVCA